MLGFDALSAQPLATVPAVGGGALTLDVSPATITLTGQSVGLKTAENLSVTAGAITLTGQSVGLKEAKKLGVTAGAIALTGQNVALKASENLAVTAGAVTLTGQSVGLSEAKKLSVASASVSFVGQNVELIQTSLAKLLEVTAGDVTLTGQTVGLKVAKTIGVTAGVLTLTGQDVGLTESKFLQVTAVSILLSGQSVILPPKARNLPVTPATITYTGQSGIRGRLEFDMMVNQLDEEIEAGITMRQMLRIIAAGIAGTSNKEGGTITFKGVDGTTDRIVGSFDADMNRTGAVLDGN